MSEALREAAEGAREAAGGRPPGRTLVDCGEPPDPTPAEARPAPAPVEPAVPRSEAGEPPIAVCEPREIAGGTRPEPAFAGPPDPPTPVAGRAEVRGTPPEAYDPAAVAATLPAPAPPADPPAIHGGERPTGEDLAPPVDPPAASASERPGGEDLAPPADPPAVQASEPPAGEDPMPGEPALAAQPAPEEEPAPVTPDDHYRALGLAPGAPRDQVDRAYRFCRDMYGPGSLATYSLLEPQEVEAARARVDEAYQVLADPTRRRAYDEPRGFPAPEAYGAAPPREGGARESERSDLPPVVNGPVLRRIRENRGISLRQIATASKVGVRYLEYIEQDRYAYLPAPVYLRGFLQEYARVVGLDPRRVSDAYLSRMSRKGP